MNRGEIIAKARLLISETDSTNSHFTDAQLDNWYEDWHKDIASFSKWPRAEATVDGGSVIGQANYPIDPTKVLEILKIYYDKKPFEIQTVDYLDEYDSEWRTADNDTPLFTVMVDSDVFAFYPPPDKAGKEIRIRYVKVPDAAADDNSVPDVVISYHTTAEIFIAGKAHRSIGNNDEADRLETLYALKKKEIKGSIKEPVRYSGWEWQGEDRI